MSSLLFSVKISTKRELQNSIRKKREKKQ